MANTTGKKYGGRQKGTPNRMTKELRSILKDILYQELEEIEEKYTFIFKFIQFRKSKRF